MPFAWLKRIINRRWERDYGETTKKKKDKNELKRSNSASTLPVQVEEPKSDQVPKTEKKPLMPAITTGNTKAQFRAPKNLNTIGTAGGHSYTRQLPHLENHANKEATANFYTQMQSGARNFQTEGNAHYNLPAIEEQGASSDGMIGEASAVGEASTVKYIALYDYEQRSSDDLTIRKDDIVELLTKSSTGWWYVKKLPSGEQGYVPSNYLAEIDSIEAEPWYFGYIRRADCDYQLLDKSNQHGSFLVRNSESRKNEYSLSVRDGEKVRHYRIKLAENGFTINGTDQFVMLQQLVNHYKANANGICTALHNPCAKVAAPDTDGLSHDTHDSWEIPREQIKLTRKLGSGNFGEVFKAEWSHVNLKVAVKTLKPGTMCKEDFLAEAQVLKTLRHQNIIQMFAVCTKDEPLYIVMELMPNGSLLNYLRDADKKMPLDQQIYIAAQVACGMAYLESKSFIHRDLAARNVLVGDNNIIKICDLGLSRHVLEDEYIARGGKFPIKWTAPEALEYNKFTSKSDVWSYGVLLYEIITHGARPYPGINNAEVPDMVNKGYRMPKPNSCPDQLYNIMSHTWHSNPQGRPSFDTLQWMMEEFFSLETSEYREPEEMA